MANSKSIGVAYEDQKIDGGTIDNTVIGATTAAAGTFTNATVANLAVTSTASIGNATTDTVSFYGVTPVAQQGGATQAAVSNSTMTTVSGSAAVSVSLNNGYAFNQTQANQIIDFTVDAKTRLSSVITLVNQLRSDLQDLGLIAGS